MIFWVRSGQWRDGKGVECGRWGGWSHAEWVGHWDRNAGMPRTSVKLSTDRAAPVHNSWNMLWLFVRKHCGRLNGRLPPEYYKKKFLTSQPEKQAIFLLIEFQIWLFMKKQSTILPLVPTGGGRCSSLDASFAQCFAIFGNIVQNIARGTTDPWVDTITGGTL